ncbi:hypothetical protein ABZ388_15500 [Micromonospora parva]|uniref:hypothetical protein n=1 Tax=Micromonospora parva TaxID=1464048 RepID=UPI0033C800E9
MLEESASQKLTSFNAAGKNTSPGATYRCQAISLCGAEITFSPQQEQAVVRMQLPGRDAGPIVRGYKYVQTRDETQPVP